MTVSGAWSRYRKARPPESPRLGRWQQVLADGLDQNLAIGVRAAVVDHLGRFPTRAELTAARRTAHSLAGLGRARVHHVPGADADNNAGDRSYLVLARPGVIMNDHPTPKTRGCGQRSCRWRDRPQSCADRAKPQTLPPQCGRGCPAHQRRGVGRQIGCRRIGSLADAFIELRRLELRLDRRIRRDRDAWRVLQLVGSIPAPRLEPQYTRDSFTSPPAYRCLRCTHSQW